jgi:heavy metal translocating P-type ATPase
MPLHFEIRHAIPGRIRLFVPAIRLTEGVDRACIHLISRQKGITDVRINHSASCVVVYFDPKLKDLPMRLKHALGRTNVSEMLLLAKGLGNSFVGTSSSNGNTGAQNATEVKVGLRQLALPTTSLGLSLLGGPLGTAVALPLIGYNALPTVKRALTVLRHEHRLNVDFLDGLAIAVSTLQGNLFTSAFVTWLIHLGDFIRDLTTARSKRAMSDLLEYQKRKAWVLRGTKKTHVAVNEIVCGDTVIVYSGGMVPVDGEVVNGVAMIDQQSLTGESMPVEKRVGDKVYAATLVRDGKVYLRAERVGLDTTAAQIVKMVEAAPIGETRIQNYAEKFADGLVAPSLALAGGFYALTQDMNRLLSMLIVDYGTGIRVAAPTSVLSSMRYAARQGILIKGGGHMEKLNQVDTIVFDKTGTLTGGQPQVLDVLSYDERRFNPRRIISLAAAAEARLKHPVAEAILTKARELRIRIPERDESQYYIGLGVEVQVNGFLVQVGSERFMRERGVKLDQAFSSLRQINERGYSSLILAVDGRPKGSIVYTDLLRRESLSVLKVLTNRGMSNLIMMTGDNSTVANKVASQLGLKRFYYEVFPEEKAEIIKQLQREGHVVAMVGDGINDSPALAYADIGIAMKNGAEIAQQTADVVLMEENLWKLIAAFDISREAISLIRQNFAIIAGLNTLALTLSIPSGMVSPSLTALISNGSAILAGLNAVRPALRH